MTTYHACKGLYDAKNASFISPDNYWTAYNRTTSIDSIIQSGNLYSYSGSNPLKYTDPTGRDYRDIHGNVIDSWALLLYESANSSANSTTANTPSPAVQNVMETILRQMIPFRGIVQDVREYAQRLECEGTQATTATIGTGFLWFDGVPISNVRTYSRSTDSSVVFHLNGTPTNFTVGEFASTCGAEDILIDDLLIYYLQIFRNRFDSAISISSGYRTEERNRAVGGASRSQHLYGTAADFKVEGFTPQQVQEFARSQGFGTSIGGLGLGGTFTHIDTRATPATWNY